MKRTPLFAVLLLAGCATSAETAAPVPVPVVSSAPTTAAPTAVCMVGAWTSTGFDITVGKLHESGGAGVRMTIGPTGAAEVVFDGMKPVRFSGQATGTVTFHGSTSGAVKLPAAGVAEGKWVTAGPADVGGLTADVSMTAPAKLSMRNLAVGDLAKGMAGASAPQITSGTWRCAGNTLVSAAPTGRWTLTRDH